MHKGWHKTFGKTQTISRLKYRVPFKCVSCWGDCLGSAPPFCLWAHGTTPLLQGSKAEFPKTACGLRQQPPSTLRTGLSGDLSISSHAAQPGAEGQQALPPARVWKSCLTDAFAPTRHGEGGWADRGPALCGPGQRRPTHSSAPPRAVTWALLSPFPTCETDLTSPPMHFYQIYSVAATRGCPTESPRDT